MPKLLSDSTAIEVTQLIQRSKDMGELPQSAVNVSTPEEAFFKLTSDLGDGLWEADEQERNSTTHAWDDLTGGRELDSDVPLFLEGGAVDQVIKAVPSRDVAGDPIWIGIPLTGGGSSLIWLTTDNTGLSFADGATFDRPAGTGTALTVSDTYYIATPWNTRIVAPNNHFGYFVQDGTDWYKSITEFAVQPSVNYPSGSGDGIETFDCYMNRSDLSLSIGDETAFPSGIKVILDGFDNVNAGSLSLSYFNGKTFDARYDTAANIIYLVSKDRF